MVSKAFGLSQLGDTDSIRVDSANNILQVTGSVRVTENVAFDTINSVRIAEPSANTLTIHTAGSERLRVDSSGLITSPISGLQIISGTSVSSNTGTSIDFTGIPSWVKRITVMFRGVSTNGSSIILVRLGTSSGVVTTGYISAAWTGNITTISQTIGLGMSGLGSASYALHGNLILCYDGSNWTSSHVFNQSGADTIAMGGGSIALGATLDRIRITTVNGTDTFDAGTINILYE